MDYTKMIHILKFSCGCILHISKDGSKLIHVCVAHARQVFEESMKSLGV